MFTNMNDTKQSGLVSTMQENDHCNTTYLGQQKASFKNANLRLEGVLMNEQNIQNYLDWSNSKGDV